LVLCLTYSTWLLAYNQLYLALPAEVERATGSPEPERVRGTGRAVRLSGPHASSGDAWGLRDRRRGR
ncbi:hypothetical protein ACWEP3_32980, partial [Streptomyces albidoflavus]